MTGEEFGIYIKRVVGGGLAALDGQWIFGILSFLWKDKDSYCCYLILPHIGLIVTLCSRSA